MQDTMAVIVWQQFLGQTNTSSTFYPFDFVVKFYQGKGKNEKEEEVLCNFAAFSEVKDNTEQHRHQDGNNYHLWVLNN